MPSILLDISNPNLNIPELLVLDASLILELTPNPVRPHPHHTLAVNFLNRLQAAAQQGQVMTLLPRLAFEECYFKICLRFLVPDAKRVGMHWHDYYKKNPTAIRAATSTLTLFYQLLQAFPIEVIEPEDLAVTPKGREPPLADRLGDLINQFAVLPKDATILGEAERLGIYTVATLDSDWTRADGFTVIIPV